MYSYEQSCILIFSTPHIRYKRYRFFTKTKKNILAIYYGAIFLWSINVRVYRYTVLSNIGIKWKYLREDIVAIAPISNDKISSDRSNLSWSNISSSHSNCVIQEFHEIQAFISSKRDILVERVIEGQQILYLSRYVFYVLPLTALPSWGIYERWNVYSMIKNLIKNTEDFYPLRDVTSINHRYYRKSVSYLIVIESSIINITARKCIYTSNFNKIFRVRVSTPWWNKLIIDFFIKIPLHVIQHKCLTKKTTIIDGSCEILHWHSIPHRSTREAQHNIQLEKGRIRAMWNSRQENGKKIC